eukprot:CAMPEP_0198198046 /NCGR_PEP_ID=MMETSP1445-20131203/1563_1 /TAXON_ID=36898 /ORGANISM="Pyramimonas sp., Strain CCMP2087" /LENGTH=222 /DNA_ID=CAMNT_0043867489 /DNA_START=262 /DNA_END=930 /DNA_ORIENTATION=+
MVHAYSLHSCIRSGALQRFASVTRFRVGTIQHVLPTLTRGFAKKAKGKKKEEEELKIHEEDEDLFESMLGDWDGDDDFKKDSEGKPTNFQKGDAHEGVDGIGSMSAAGGAVLATLASLVIFAGGTALVMGAVKGLAVMKPEDAAAPATDATAALSASQHAAHTAHLLVGASTPMSKDALELELQLLRQSPPSDIVDAQKASIKAQLKVLALKSSRAVVPVSE